MKPDMKPDTDKEPILRVEKISKAFGGIQALNGVSFDVHTGEILGIIGPNGSGENYNCKLHNRIHQKNFRADFLPGQGYIRQAAP